MLRRLSALLLPLVMVLLAAAPALADTPSISRTQTTASYKIRLEIGPLSKMLMPNQAKTAKSGMVMVPMPGVPMPKMSMMEDGHPVNHHLEAYIFDKATGVDLTKYRPTITITDSAGVSRTVADTVLMYDVSVGKSDMHFGNNVYMSGTYTVSVKVNGQTATFRNVTLKSVSLPKTGSDPVAWWVGLALLMLGGMLVVFRFRRRVA